MTAPSLIALTGATGFIGATLLAHLTGAGWPVRALYRPRAGRALVVAINKWDAASTEQREEVKREIGRKLAFLDFATQLPISAREGRGLLARSLQHETDRTLCSVSADRLSTRPRQKLGTSGRATRVGNCCRTKR